MKTAIVITGASSGIGKSLAEYFLRKGRTVIGTYRKEKDIIPGTQAMILDLAQEQTIVQAFASQDIDWSSFSRIDLINNAGIAVAGPVEKVSLQEWREQFEVNVFGLISFTQKLLPEIRRTKGTIINMSSISGLLTFPFMGPYCASKYAVEAISDALRRECAPLEVKVVLVEPGAIETPIWGKNLGKAEVEAEADTISAEKYGPYQKSFIKFQKMVKQIASQAAPVELLPQTVEKILQSKYPKDRYVVGRLDTKIQAKILPHLPGKWVDRFIRTQI